MRIIRYFIAFVIVVIASCADREQMLRQLEQAEQQNRDYVPFTSDSLALVLTDYFDSHGTPNERMRSHYILGCAYRDLGEAPRALECYNDAVECADTTAKDCDFKTLSRVYGQATDIFTDQYLLDEAMKSSIKSYNYAILSKDTLAAIINIERRALIYSLENKEDSAFYYRKNATSSYLSIGDIQGYAESHYSLLLSYLNYNDYVNAKKSINIYESMSGLFNDSGHIVKGKELYYYEKGLYFLGVNILDTAEIYFRRTLEHSDNHNLEEAGNYGLYLLYNKKHMPDSAAKYANLAYTVNNQRDLEKATVELQRAQLNYNYIRNERIAKQERDRRQSLTLFLTIAIALTVIITIVALVITREMAAKRKAMMREYRETLRRLAKEQSEQLIMNELGNKELIEEKSKTIIELQNQLAKLRKKAIDSRSEGEDKLLTSEAVMRMHYISKTGIEKPSKELWLEFSELVNDSFPDFYTKVNSGHMVLNDTEYKICMLTKAKFKPFEICNLLDLKPANVSLIRSRLMNKVFNKNGSGKDFDSMIHELP
jgi:hypothetical protein